MIILSIDPGTIKMGVAVFEDEKLVESKQIYFKECKNRNQKLIKTNGVIQNFVRRYSPDVILIEEPIFINAKSYRVQCNQILIIELACWIVDELYKPVMVHNLTWKAIIGSGKWKGEDVKKFIKKKYHKIFGEDESCAIGIGLACLKDKKRLIKEEE